jgi:hypothetical protein
VALVRSTDQVCSLQRRVGLLRQPVSTQRPHDMFCAPRYRCKHGVMTSGFISGRRGEGRSSPLWAPFVFAGAVASHFACGGSVGSAPVNGSVPEGGNRVSDASSYDQACSESSECDTGAGNQSPPGDEDAAAFMEATAAFDAGVLCGYHTGPVRPGQDAGGPAMRCTPSFVCVNLDKGWACCSVEGGGGVSLCLPFLTD